MAGVVAPSNLTTATSGTEDHICSRMVDLERRVQNLEQNLPKPKKNRKRSKEYTRSNNRPSTMHDMYSSLKEAIQENIEEFTDNIDVEGSELLDKLYEQGCINADEKDDILARSTQKQRVRFLISRLHQRPEDDIKQFIKILREDNAYSHITRKVDLTVEKILNGGEHKIKCLFCLMFDTVNIRDIADFLWKKKILKTEHWDAVASDDFDSDEIMNDILSSLEKTEDIGALKAALSGKYSHIVQMLPNNATVFECMCIKRRSLRRRPSDCSTISERSTTSTTLARSDSVRSIISSRFDDDNISARTLKYVGPHGNGIIGSETRHHTKTLTNQFQMSTSVNQNYQQKQMSTSTDNASPLVSSIQNKALIQNRPTIAQTPPQSNVPKTLQYRMTSTLKPQTTPPPKIVVSPTTDAVDNVFASTTDDDSMFSFMKSNTSQKRSFKTMTPNGHHRSKSLRLDGNSTVLDWIDEAVDRLKKDLKIYTTGSNDCHRNEPIRRWCKQVAFDKASFKKYNKNTLGTKDVHAFTTKKRRCVGSPFYVGDV